MEILIGRESAHNRLSVVVDQKPKLFGNEGSVPMSVSRKHCTITVDPVTRKMRITNCNPDNITMVNGMTVNSLTIKAGDTIYLGKDYYRLDWDVLNQVIIFKEEKKPREVDIRHLEKIWNSYRKQLDSLSMSEKLTNVLRGGIPIITIGAVAMGLMFTEEIKKNPIIMISVYAVVLTILVFLFVKSLFDARRIPKQKEKLSKLMIKKYTCPDCGYYFGNNSYDIIKINMDNCPKCKAKLIK